jgi:hypothetical protein
MEYIKGFGAGSGKSNRRLSRREGFAINLIKGAVISDIAAY